MYFTEPSTKASELRKKGKKVGVIKLRTLRPLPFKDLKKAFKKLKGLAVLDRHISLGYEGPVFSELNSIASELELNPLGYIAGLGGRDISLKHIESVYNDLMNGKQSRVWLM